MISGHIGAGQYILFQRDPRVQNAPLLEVGRLVVTELDGDTRVEHWFLYTSAPVGSGYAAYLRPSSSFLNVAVGLAFRGAGAPPPDFNVTDSLARLALSTSCGIEYIEARCDRLPSNNAGSLGVSAAMPSLPQQVDLGIYDITQGNQRVGVLVVTPTAGGTLEAWHLFDRVMSGGTLSTSTPNEGPYTAPDPNLGGTYALTYLGSVSTPDLSGRAVVTVNALCAVAA